MMTTLLIILSFILVLVGLAGVILPIVPSVTIAWLGFLLFAYVTGFSAITWLHVIIFFGLMILSIVLDAVAPLLGATKYRASKFGMLGAIIGLWLGIMALGPIGIIIGPCAGAFLGEYLAGRKPEEAFQSAKGTIIGFLAGSLIKTILILTMLGFLISALI